MILTRILVLSMLAFQVACKRARPFEFEVLRAPMSFTEKESKSGAFSKTIFRHPQDDLELHVQTAEKVKTEGLAELLEAKTAQVEILYGATTPAYLGQVTKLQLCAAEFNREVWRDPSGHRVIYTLFANSRFALGACAKEQAMYRVAYLLLYCAKSESLYELKLFSKSLSREALLGLAKMVECTN